MYIEPTKTKAKDSPILSTLAKIYLQFFEELTIRNWMESVEIYYRRYVDDILIIFDQNKTNKYSISKYMNNIYKYLEFKLTEEENNRNYLDTSVHRHNNNLYLGIYRKSTQTNTTIHFTLNHSLELKLACTIST